MTGEVVLRISHCVIGCPGSSLETIRRIQSHPVALAQCERFFAAHPGIAKAIAEDTAGSVRQIMERGDPTVAAIAGEFAAREYGAQILVSGRGRRSQQLHPLRPAPGIRTSATGEAIPDADATPLSSPSPINPARSFTRLSPLPATPSIS